jgi:hypothetical protein
LWILSCFRTAAAELRTVSIACANSSLVTPKCRIQYLASSSRSITILLRLGLILLIIFRGPGYSRGERSRIGFVPLDGMSGTIDHRAMGFNRCKLEDRRREAAEKEAANRRATEAQVLEDAERLIAAWNERQAKLMPMLFSPTIGAAIAARYWFLWVRCPACRTINAICGRSTVTAMRL